MWGDEPLGVNGGLPPHLIDEPARRGSRKLNAWTESLLLGVTVATINEVKGATVDRADEIPEDLQKVTPGDWVYVKVFKRQWNEPRREGPYKVVLTTPIAVKVQGNRRDVHNVL
ncbi:hypothetical protein AGOR_G00179980 [Albula goreensis]|uniref:Murine leukemia virus integrase C-terminal domain-containing protein n=1 Tax=Albula goreensis TaxID=1534307 RepID=A0A8T3CUB1_9TELE|nr:hypothetical protein AGOR_G00179980 [Albula goreensis]